MTVEIIVKNDWKAPQWQIDPKGQRRPEIGQDPNDKKAKGPKGSKEAQNHKQNDPIKPKARNDQWPKQAEQSQNVLKGCKNIQNFWKSA